MKNDDENENFLDENDPFLLDFLLPENQNTIMWKTSKGFKYPFTQDDGCVDTRHFDTISRVKGC